LFTVAVTWTLASVCAGEVTVQVVSAELSGLDLHRMDDLVALWWALERRRVRGDSEQPNASSHNP
jgi:hypothetical protein